ncbi:MAG: ATP-binding cassette domain-containing protein [Gaiellaceae bacterium]
MSGRTAAILMDGVGVRRGKSWLLSGIDWRVEPGEQWALLGPNGAGKSTLLTLAAAVMHPTEGRVELLGERMGRTDVRRLREKIGVVENRLDRKLDESYEVSTIVLTGATGTRIPLWERYDAGVRARAAELIELFGCADLADRPFGICSQGERQRVLLARALMSSPRLLLLDEPAAALDLPAREALLAALEALTGSDPELTTVLATHHLEELPRTTTHALLLHRGEPVGLGPVEETLTNETLSRCFAIPVEVNRRDGRWWAHAPAGWRRG